MRGRNWLGDIIRTAAMAVTVAAVVQELRKPKEERTWHGTVLGMVPYDFRIPTWEQVKESYWNPDDPTIFTPRPLGVGWGINVPSLLRWMQQFVEQLRNCCAGCCGG